VLREPVRAEQFAGLAGCLSGLRLDVLQLGLERLVDDVHGGFRGGARPAAASPAGGGAVTRRVSAEQLQTNSMRPRRITVNNPS
jgi:hypothetical protein